MKGRLWVTLLWSLLGASEGSFGQAQKPSFKCDQGCLRVGLDDRVYVSAEGLVLSCGRDGSSPVAAPPSTAVVNATASAEGIIAVAHAHFAKDVTLYGREFEVLGRFSRFADAGYRSPAGVAAGPSGDFYALDQGRDRIVRFHPDGIRCGVYQVPREPAGPAGELARFRVSERTKAIYVVDRAPVVRCFSTEGTPWKPTLRKLWEVRCEGSLEGGCELFWGYGGFDVDESGLLYLLSKTGTVLKRFDPEGHPLSDVALDWGTLQPTEKEFVRDLQVSRGEVFVKRAHPAELFQRFDLASGRRKTGVAAPPDYSALVREPKSPNGGGLIKPVSSTLGIPQGRGKPLRVLFIGNSQINCVRDIPEIVEELSRSAKGTKAPLILAEEVSVGGVGLEGYWKNGLGGRRIAAGGWDWIVLNEIVYSYGGPPSKFQEFARKFISEANKVGARVMFFATAEVEAAKTRQGAMYHDAVEMARECGGRVAGGGMAWQRVWAERPTQDFYFTDRAHPNPAGYYLNACVIYSALTGQTPEGLDPGDLPGDQATLLQRVAWEQSLEDRKEESKPKGP